VIKNFVFFSILNTKENKMPSYDLDVGEYEMDQISDNDDDYDYDRIVEHHVDWRPFKLDLDLLKYISELGNSLNQYQLENIEEMISEEANIEGIDLVSFPVDGELDEMYDGVDRLTSQTPLIWAILANNKQAVDFLLNVGADPNNPNVDGQTPLEVAIESENPDIVDLLLSMGSQLNDPMQVIRTLEQRISEGDQNASQLSQITSSLYNMIFTRVEQRGGYYL